jgi:hypothetical protein
MVLKPKGEFDDTADAKDLRFYVTSDGDGGEEIHCTALFDDSEGRVYSEADTLATMVAEASALSGIAGPDIRAALAALRDAFAARVAAKHFDEVA